MYVSIIQLLKQKKDQKRNLFWSRVTKNARSAQYKFKMHETNSVHKFRLLL